MSTDASLMHLGDSSAEAVERALLRVLDGVERVGPVTIGHGTEQSAEQAVQGLDLPAVYADVAYVDGVSGGNVFLLPVAGARKLAAAMEGSGEPSADGAELTELELSAVGEAMNQMMSAAASATKSVLGQEVEIAPPQIRVLTTEEEAAELLRATAAPHVLTSSFTVADCSARLVQLVPNAFVVRMDRALESQTTSYTSAPLGNALRAVPVRVWAELGRARMPAGASLGMATGSVLELDREVDEPVDLYVDGLRFATGRLVVADDGSLQLEVEEILGLSDGEPAADNEIEAAMPAVEPAEPVAEAEEPADDTAQTEPDHPTEESTEV
jgi:flagellar motor switch protein FliN/FliY